MGERETSSGVFQDYDTALAFAHAYLVLIKQFETGIQVLDYSDGMLLIPIIVNGAFACELFLKALLLTPSRGHLLKDLFLRLDNQDNDLCERIRQKTIYELRKDNKEYNENDFWGDLESMSKAFEELRYFHEPQQIPKQLEYNLGFLYTFCCVLKANCEVKYGRRPLLLPNQE